MLLDNINNLWGDELKQAIKSGSKLKIAASCFSIYAFESLKKELKKIDSLEFIFTAPAFTADKVTDKLSKQRREFHLPQQQREQDLYGSEFEIKLKNKLTQKAIAKECADWIKRKVKFRSNNTNSAMQQFAYLDNNEETLAYMPLQGFTAVDLGYQKGNAISNIINRLSDNSTTKIYLDLFNNIWKNNSQLEDVTEAICAHIESVYQENSPEKLYFFILYNIFSQFLADITDDFLPNDKIGYKNTIIWNKLYNFQRDAATGIINKLESYNGCILADSVGLGKTFTAMAVIKYYELRNKDVLVLCPKKLIDNWQNYNSNLKTNILRKDRLSYDVLAHTDLQRTRGKSSGIDLSKINWGNYDLVVIDESHNFRNNEAYKDKENRYQKLMNLVIRSGIKTKVLMLSATPVNNKFNDLKNQLALAYEGNSSELSSKLKTSRSIEEIFRNAQLVFNSWTKKKAQERTATAILDALDYDFFELLDSVTIARSRKHIEAFYDTTDIGSFPQRLKPISYHCKLTDQTEFLDFNAICEQLGLLNLSIYTPINYILPSRLDKYTEIYDTSVKGGKSILRQADREKSLQSLITTNLLKRLESSVAAFRLTLQSLATKHTEILNSIATMQQQKELTIVDCLEDSLDDEELEDFTFGTKIKIHLKDMDIISWQAELSADLLIINELLAEIQLITPEHDYKLNHLKQRINDKIANPINPNNKKIVVFTAFADTADYLYENIKDELCALNIHSAKITGSTTPKNTIKAGYDFQQILTLFSPIAKEKQLIMPDVNAEIDLLIATDCIAEGQNLQDCDYLINYDIHWNPVRIMQRFGRIDRIGSPNTKIQLVNYWPDISLDDYINLKERVENRMHIVDLSATGDDNLLANQTNDIDYRTEQLQRLQNSVVEVEDLKTGVNITDLGLNDFRIDLLNYTKNNNDLEQLPSGLHAILPANNDIGLCPGVIFALRNRNSNIDISQHNQLHPYYLVYIDNNGEIVYDHTKVKHLLDLIRASCKDKITPISDLCNLFNKQTQDGKNMQVYSDLLNQAISSMIAVKQQKDIDSLFSSNQTSALIDNFASLNDFELIAFLVIK